MTPLQRANFERLLTPRHIAFIGGADALIAITEARRRGYAGQYWPVNPRRRELGGIPCFASIDDLPDAPDAVFLAIPAAHVSGAVRQLAEMGTGGIVCYSAGFKEAGEDGKKSEAALKRAVGDTVLIGPNCYGLINYLDNVALWPFAHGGGSPGYGAAIITQSGMLSSDITMSQRSVPLTHMISAGNQAVLGLEDFVDLLSDKPEVRAIGVHIEGLLDIARFERIALKSIARGTPIVALKTGCSKIGSALTVSHTGSLSGSAELYEALFARTGVISVDSPAQLLETLKYLCVAGVPTGRRIAGFTCSGGGATMLADHAERIGLDFPSFDAPCTETLRGLLPSIATVSNPLDYTTPIWGQPEATGPIFAHAIGREGIDAAILVQDYPAEGLAESQIFYRNDALAFAEAATAAGRPAAICSTLPENLDTETRDLLIERGVAPMQGLPEGLNAIRDAAMWNEARARIAADPPAPLACCNSAPAAKICDEVEGKAWLAGSDLEPPVGRCVSGAQAASAATDIGFPVALKMVSAHLPHKTEAGAVALDLQSADAVTQAVAQMTRAVAAHSHAAVTDRFLIEAMVDKPLAELVVAIRRDPQFGAAMTLGSGGVLVELIGDAVTLLLPTSEAEILRALTSLKVARLLGGYRGGKRADLGALTRALTRLSEFALARRDTLVDLELNPVFVYENRVVAVDVLLEADTSQ